MDLSLSRDWFSGYHRLCASRTWLDILLRPIDYLMIKRWEEQPNETSQDVRVKSEMSTGKHKEESEDDGEEVSDDSEEESTSSRRRPFNYVCALPLNRSKDPVERYPFTVMIPVEEWERANPRFETVILG